MKKSSIIFILLILSLITVKNISAQENNKEKFLKAVVFLEENPLEEKAKETRKWAMPYSQEIDYPFCEKIAFLFMRTDVPGEVLSQYLIKLAAYDLENSEKNYDVNSAQKAGIESAIRVYEKILAKNPKSKSKTLDKFLLLRNRNVLDNFIKTAKCSD